MRIYEQIVAKQIGTNRVFEPSIKTEMKTRTHTRTLNHCLQHCLQCLRMINNKNGVVSGSPEYFQVFRMAKTSRTTARRILEFLSDNLLHLPASVGVVYLEVYGDFTVRLRNDRFHFAVEVCLETNQRIRVRDVDKGSLGAGRAQMDQRLSLSALFATEGAEIWNVLLGLRTYKC